VFQTVVNRSNGIVSVLRTRRRRGHGVTLHPLLFVQIRFNYDPYIGGAVANGIANKGSAVSIIYLLRQPIVQRAVDDEEEREQQRKYGHKHQREREYRRVVEVLTVGSADGEDRDGDGGRNEDDEEIVVELEMRAHGGRSDAVHHQVEYQVDERHELHQQDEHETRLRLEQVVDDRHAKIQDHA